jgi:propanol-preferring alcohol dehydrogenase
MKAFRLAGWKQGGHVVEVDTPRPGAGQVLVRMGGAGICHSDLHLMHEWSPEERPELAAMAPDFTLGHENAGWVEQLGAGVEGLEPGQAVVVSPVWGCGRCAPYRDGDDNYCEGPRTGSGGLGRDGGLASHMVAPASALVPLRELDPAEAAPLTDAGLTSYHAVKSAVGVLRPDATALVIGVGGLGHMAVAYLRELTGGPVIAVDPSETARGLASRLGADHVLDSNGDTAGMVRELTRGLGARAVFDFVGVDATLKLAASAVRGRGKITLVGLGGGSLPFRFGALPYATTIGITFGGSRSDLAEVVALAETGRVRPHIQHFEFEQVEEAYRALQKGTIEGRAVIRPPC